MAAYTLGWKVEEPTPPLTCNEDDLWLFPEDSIRTNLSEPENFGTLNKRELAEQLLEDIDSIVKNEENDSFSDWIEETIDLHLFDEIQPVVPAEEPKSETENTVVDTSVETTDFTPPYTPADTSDSCLALNYDTLNPVALPSETIPDSTYQTLSNFVLTPDDNLAETQSFLDQPGLSPENTSQPSSQVLTAPPTPVPDLEKEMELVEEVVRRTAQGIGSHQIVIWELKLSNRRRIRSSFDTESDSDDSDWVPPSNKKRKTSKSPRKKSKPSERPKTQEDRASRKKEQNKVAAVRYRQRKKAELREMLKQEKMLEQKRDRLRLRLAELQMEVKCMKSIMRDMFMSNVN